MINEPSSTFLSNIRILEFADEIGEYCGKLLAGLGAEVIKIESPGGEATRQIGPFLDDQPNPDRSLHFWHYNFGKTGIVLDLDTPSDLARCVALAETADVILDTRPRGWLAARGLDRDALATRNPGLITARITPFGDDGPWADYCGSDLIHLALGGMASNTGYDALPSGEYDLPPIAPQMWHSYHIAGELMAIQILAALNYRHASGRGQALSGTVHGAVSVNTELDFPCWIYSRQPVLRQTCRHAFPQTTPRPADSMVNGLAMAPISRTRDGRWILAHRSFLPGFVTPIEDILHVMEDRNFAHGLDDPAYRDLDTLRQPEIGVRIGDVVDRFVAKYDFEHDLWKAAQDARLPWAPLRKPEENVGEAHWRARETFFEVDHPELGRRFTMIGAKWMAPEVPWRRGPRAPLLGEHNDLVTTRPARAASPSTSAPTRFALEGVRIIDLSWLLASGGAGRFFTAHGAEVIKVEHESRPDGMRFGGAFPPAGGRAERDAATVPLSGVPGGLNRSGAFMDINVGKRSFSLNLKHPQARPLLTDLIRNADMVIEGFSPGTMDRMGLGYEKLREINPRIIYVQQSGLGQIGTYGELRSFGPSAQAFSGLSEMSGLPEPRAPAGIGYSYLDWFGAYQMATAMMAALFRQRQTGKGCWIDSSQVETGLYLTGTAVLDHSANGRTWQRYGNRSPYKLAAPHGIYRCKGEDHWIAIAAFDETQWQMLAHVLDRPEWVRDAGLSTLALRLSNQDRLDRMVSDAVAGWDRYELMDALQKAHVPAGVCQTAEDRCDRDPQLRHQNWLVELDQTEIGRWPAKDIPIRFSETAPNLGGLVGRHGPNYGEDNEYVLRTLLGLDDAAIAQLTADGVF